MTRGNKKRDPGKLIPEAPTPVAYGSDSSNKEKSPAAKRMTFAELAEELSRRSDLE